MNNMEKLTSMNKILRELEDVSNSSTALLKKIAQVEAENINLGNKILEEKIPDVFEHMNGVLTETGSLLTEFTAFRDKFVVDNKLEEVAEPVV
jgi:division protein CdvB (Snf7/Vps24/ESCRT-III family)